MSVVLFLVFFPVCIPQLFPLMNTMVQCNQIITINNPLQPIGITSVGTQQSSTPGLSLNRSIDASKCHKESK